MTTPYYPQGNGQVERTHQTLGNKIGKLEDKYKKQWPKHLAKLTHAYNSIRSAVTRSLAPLFNVWSLTETAHIFVVPYTSSHGQSETNGCICSGINWHTKKNL